MAGARHVGIEKLKRMRNRGTASQVVGPEIHRDVPFRPGVSGDESPCVEYVMFSCPHNAENAVTEVINVKKAIESIAPEMREKTEVRVETMDLNRKGGNVVRCNLNQALAVLSNPIESLDNFREISLLADPVGAEGKAFNEAIAKHGALVNLQPGDMLVLNQHKIFHRAHSGHPEMIAHPHMLSRLLFANSGVAAR
jgi:hypothetical protein